MVFHSSRFRVLSMISTSLIFNSWLRLFMKFSRGLPLLLSPSIFPVTTMFSSPCFLMICSTSRITQACVFTPHHRMWLVTCKTPRRSLRKRSAVFGIYLAIISAPIRSQRRSPRPCNKTLCCHLPQLDTGEEILSAVGSRCVCYHVTSMSSICLSLNCTYLYF